MVAKLWLSADGNELIMFPFFWFDNLHNDVGNAEILLALLAGFLFLISFRYGDSEVPAFGLAHCKFYEF
jgi:hypothetical protein